MIEYFEIAHLEDRGARAVHVVRSSYALDLILHSLESVWQSKISATASKILGLEGSVSILCSQ